MSWIKLDRRKAGSNWPTTWSHWRKALLVQRKSEESKMLLCRFFVWSMILSVTRFRGPTCCLAYKFCCIRVLVAWFQKSCSICFPPIGNKRKTNACHFANSSKCKESTPSVFARKDCSIIDLIIISKTNMSYIPQKHTIEFLFEKDILPLTINTCLCMDVSKHILVSRYIHIETSISGRREYPFVPNTHMLLTKRLLWLLALSITYWSHIVYIYGVQHERASLEVGINFVVMQDNSTNFMEVHKAIKVKRILILSLSLSLSLSISLILPFLLFSSLL
jgi:hypothetical protein